MTAEATTPTDDAIVDASPALDPATFDLTAWINGATSTVRAVTLYQRADLLAEVDELNRQLRLAESIPEGDRGMGDPSPQGIRRKLEQVAGEFQASAVVFKVESRSTDARERIAKRAKKQGVTDENEVVLHQLVDAIKEPAGVTVEHLRTLNERSEAQVRLLMTAASMANVQAPRVDVPFSSESSGSRKRQ